MRGDLIAILCDRDHSISFLLLVKDDNGEASVQHIKKDIFKGDIADTTQITYSELILIRHANNAYQIYLQTESDKDGISMEFFEVFFANGQMVVFQT